MRMTIQGKWERLLSSLLWQMSDMVPKFWQFRQNSSLCNLRLRIYQKRLQKEKVETTTSFLFCLKKKIYLRIWRKDKNVKTRKTAEKKSKFETNFQGEADMTIHGKTKIINLTKNFYGKTKIVELIKTNDEYDLNILVLKNLNVNNWKFKIKTSTYSINSRRKSSRVVWI